MITSVQNPKIQWVRKLQNQPRLRREEAVFVVEGVRLVEEALAAGWQASLVLFTQGLSERGAQVVQGFARLGAQVEQVSSGVMEAISDTQTPQGLLAVVKTRLLPFPERLDFVLVVDGVRDPGNLGTILRTAAAAGVQAVLLPPGNVDAWAPKVLRAAMGAHFRLPLRSLNWEALNDLLYRLPVYLADAGSGLPYTQANLCSPLALMVGGEAAGAGQQGQNLASQRIHIPMPGEMESLNAAAAAAVLLFEIVRQRTEVEKAE
ncbi:MAG: RNA methyltransferase [Anaerolineales bacterium]|nr:RNA methyltransferase [Anaerolineales bacterium]